jgi:poly-gamma-glutamate synthesis protein (capsule biosynthesis protein)
VIFAGAGDVFLDRPDPVDAFGLVRPVFDAADVRFANLEGVYATTYDRAPSAGVGIIGDPAQAAGIREAGFNVLSLANNHSVDGGHSGLLATKALFAEAGVQTPGAGADLAEARRPAIVDTPGGRVAVLAYASVFPRGYQARRQVPGLAPLRAHTCYEPWEEAEWNPGLLPRVFTVPHAADTEDFVADIEAARDTADFVVVSVHWGDFTRPYVVTDHERRAARIAIDAGADLVVGHHHHLLRGIEFHRGKPVLYGLGHFAFDLPRLDERLAAEGYLGQTTTAEKLAARRRFGDFALREREGYPLLPFHPDSRMTVVAVVRLHAGQDPEVGLVPCLIDPDGRPRPARDGEERDAVAGYLRRCCELEELPVQVGDGGEHAGEQLLTVAEKG